MGHSIKWREIDEQRLALNVKRYNAKIRRVGVRKPEIAGIQPSKVSLKDLRAELKAGTRKEFNRMMAKMERYLKKGAEMPYTTHTGAVITKFAKREAEIAINTINARLKSERNLLGVKPPKAGEMGSVIYNQLRPLDQTKVYNVQKVLPKDWAKFAQNLEAMLHNSDIEIKSERYKENYIKAVETALGPNSPVIEAVKKMNPKDLYRAFYESPMMQIDFYYEPIEAERKEELILSFLDQFE